MGKKYDCYVDVSKIPENDLTFMMGLFKKFDIKYYVGFEDTSKFINDNFEFTICSCFKDFPIVDIDVIGVYSDIQVRLLNYLEKYRQFSLAL